jgi:hypothetical protein
MWKYFLKVVSGNAEILAVGEWQKITLVKGLSNFPKLKGPPQNSICQESDVSMFHTVNSQFWDDLGTSLVCGSFAQWMLIDMHFCMWHKESCSNYAKCMGCHTTKFSCLCNHIYGFVHNCFGVTFYMGFNNFVVRLLLAAQKYKFSSGAFSSYFVTGN